MAEFVLDRLTLKLSGLSQHDGERLAERVAETLAVAALPCETPLQIDTLHVRLRARPEDGIDQLATRIVAEVLRQVERTF